MFAFADLSRLRAPFSTHLSQKSVLRPLRLPNNHTGESYQITSSGTNDQVSAVPLDVTRNGVGLQSLVLSESMSNMFSLQSDNLPSLDQIRGGERSTDSEVERDDQ
jgi:hypothetical protein